jgi:ribonucleoside-diphosphate reductase beta chain
MSNIFTKRVAFKPFEYPEVVDFQNAILHSFWTPDEFNYTSDVQDFHTKLTPVERAVIKNSLMAISQIEVSVKRFWGRIGEKFPKAEIENCGAVFSMNEVIHSTAYANLLEILGFNDDFSLLLENPVIQGRVDYLTKYLKGASDSSNENYTMTLALFALFIENVSLFSQFLIIKAFYNNKGLIKGVDNVISATMKEETVHALFGAHLINIIKSQFPEWFNEDFYHKLELACKKAYKAECDIIDWIHSDGELDFIPKDVVVEFIKSRFNEGLAMIGGAPVFEVDQSKLEQVRWFDEEIHGEMKVDFFHKRSVAYNKFTKSVTAEDLF